MGIERFELSVPAAELEELRDRLRRARWPEAATAPGWVHGVPLERLRDVCATWADEYDWRALEQRLNGLGQHRARVGGLRIHFLHVRSPHAGALPLVMTHGWPGSVVEFLEVVEPLTRPDEPDDAFHVVIPSLPGYGFSEKPREPGWGVGRIAWAWAELMSRLGYERYGAQGSDWGATVCTELAKQDREHLVGIHLLPPLVAPDRDTAELTRCERAAIERLDWHATTDGGTRSTRPGWTATATPRRWSAGIACSIFPGELQRSSRRWAERRFAQIR
jgi:pimeloyl-ACP methyl ester carboxylesterase